MSVNPTTPTEFAIFPELPPEMRDFVWEKSVDDIRPRAFLLVGARRHLLSDPDNPEIPQLTTCFDSRYEFLKQYNKFQPQCAAGSDRLPPVFFLNPTKDVVLLGDHFYEIPILQAIWHFPEQLARVEQVAINPQDMEPWEELTRDNGRSRFWEALHLACPRLRKVMIVLNDGIRTKAQWNLPPNVHKVLALASEFWAVVVDCRLEVQGGGKAGTVFEYKEYVDDMGRVGGLQGLWCR